MDREAIATAYGLLWLVMGSSETDQNIRLACAARYRIRSLLSPVEMRDGITRAKIIATELNVTFKTWM